MGGGTGPIESLHGTRSNDGTTGDAYGPKLHKLMHLQADKMDLSFVEKVMIPRGEVRNLCDDLLPSSAAKSNLDFASLNNCSVHVVGLYGSKKVLVDIFRSLNFYAVASFLMEDASIDPGIYGFLHNKMLYIFYWHQGSRLQEASRKEVSCNFIRYVSDLCGTVYVCLDAEDLDAPLITTADSRAASRKQRTQRVQISVVKQSENDVSLKKGFEFTPAVLKSVETVNTSQAMGQWPVRLVSGLQRCGIMTSSVIQPRVVSMKQQREVKEQDLPGLIEKWRETYDINVMELPSPELLHFVQYGELDGRQEHTALLKSFEEKRAAHKKKFYLMDELLKREEEKVLTIFKKAQKAYLRETYSWEEAQFHITLPCADIATPSVCSSDDPEAASSGTEGKEENGTSEVTFTHSLADLNAAVVELAGIWGGTGSDCLDSPSLVFPGAEVEFIGRDGESLSGKFVLEKASSTGGSNQRNVGPILYGQEFIATAKTAGLTIKYVITCVAMDGDWPKGPLLTSRFVRTKVRESGKKGSEGVYKLVFERASARGMFEWMASYGSAVPHLEQTLQNLAWLIADPDAVFGAGDSRIILSKVRNALKAKDVLSDFRKNLSDEYIGRFLAKAMQDHCPEAKQDAIGRLEKQEHDLLVELCRKVYDGACSEFDNKLVKMVKKDIVPMVREKMQFERQVDSDSMEKSFEEDTFQFFLKLKGRLSGGNQHGRTLSVTRCFPQVLSMMQKLKISNPKASLNIHYASQETESERVTWAMAELTPMKKDLDALLLHDTHVITPECSKSCKLIEMDPNTESLFLITPVKSGEILLFVEDIKESLIHLYVIPKLGFEVNAANPIKTFKRGCDLIAVDEAARLVSFYDRKMSRVSVFRFDDTFRHFDWCDVDLLLSEYAGVKSLTSMMFIPGKREMVLVDSACKVWVFEVSQPGMLRPRHISLAGPDHKMCISSEGSCLLVIYKRTDSLENFHSADGSSAGLGYSPSSDVVDTGGGDFLKMEVYLLDETMSHLKTISLDYSIRSIESLDFGAVSFGSQAHLVALDRSRPDRGICSEIVQISSASEVCQIQTVKKTRELTTAIVQNKQSCPALEYIHLIFEKYAICPPLMQQGRKLSVQLVLGDGPLHKRDQFKEKSVGYLTSAIDRLQRDKGKDFSGLKLTIRCDCVESCIADGVLLGSTEVGTTVTAGDWLCLLVCLVPIQIARAENNSLQPMIDGLQMPASLNYADAVGLAEALRFGFYDAVLAQWPGPIKVISSMGKQSSGKSYLLNHLSGSLLDVAGGRCTDGVWMTMRASKSTNCLYVLLDFEGLGSFERSEQEDMLLSILNAAVSNITIFNKKDFHLDKETEAVFERFQNGVSLVKKDSRLFKGIFYIAIKDVDTLDVEDLKAEFYSKIQQICSNSHDNFLTRMYGGEVEIAAMPPFHRPEYHESVADIAGTVEELHPVHQTGRSLAGDLKLVIAQISARDWSPIDTKRIALKLDLLRKHLSTAIGLGRLMSPTDNVLVNFETQQEIADLSIVVDGYSFDLSDTGLELSPSQESKAVGDIFEALKNHFQISHKRSGPDHDDELWHSTFEKFLVALADRRRARILEWLSCNTCDFQDDGDVQNLRLETVATLAELTQRLSLCSSKCKACFFRCVREKSHPAGSSHHCLGTHSCNETCTFCAAEEQAGSGVLNECGDLSGHEGAHDCRTKSHTCGKDCSFVESSSNCNVSCALKTGHEGEHRCNTKQHLCAKTCSLSGCKNSCVITLEAGDHDKHLCHERMCPMTCRMLGCTSKCASDDHFHSLTSEAHFCGNEHICKEVCQAAGICEVVTEVVRKSKTFTGKRSVFEYEHVSEQNGVQKQCCIPIPPGMERHAGDHCHTVNANAVHFCTTKCAACGYLCNLPIGHPGLHDTTHGNMRDVHFVAEAEDIDLADRKYSWGESGLAEMCMMHCKAQGRGHIHLIKCNAQQPNRACAEGLLEGARHQTREYGPDKTVPKDELSHAAFWKHMRFKDPCQEDDRKQFELCNHQCHSADHSAATGSKTVAQGRSRSYCTQKLWHAPVPRAGPSTSGYVTEDGHSFSCDHVKNAPNHVVFIIDRSGSMAGGDVKPVLAKFSSSHGNRLGCVYEAILRFIRTRLVSGQPDVVSVILFDNTGSIAFERQQIAENIVDPLLQHHPRGGTTYSSGLDLAQQVLQRAFQDSSLQGKHPAIIFLSDGGNNGGTDPIAIINKMQNLDHKLVFHTILFGRDYEDQEILKRMAAAGKGTYQVSIDEVQLARSFEGLAKSLRPKVAALM